MKKRLKIGENLFQKGMEIDPDYERNYWKLGKKLSKSGRKCGKFIINQK